MKRLISAQSDELPFGLMLTAKVFALCFLVTLEPWRWAAPGLPFVGLPLVPMQAAWVVRVVAFLAIGALLVNIRPRLACLALGAAGLLTTLWNQAAYENNIVYSSLAMLMIGLYEPGPIFLLRWLVVICYGGAAIDKVLNADWRSGQFFQTWMGDVTQHAGYMALARTLPYLVVAQALSWISIGVEFGLMVGFMFRRTTRYAIPVALAFHLSMTLLTGSAFGLYTAAMCVTMLAFVHWPHAPGLVLYDDDCGICNSTRRFFQAIGDGLFTWTPNTSPAGRAYGITQDMADEAMYVLRDARVFPGFRGFRHIVLSLPITYLLLAALFCLSYARYSYRLGQLAFALFLGFGLILFTPTRLGEAVYQFVATHRHLISRACRLPTRTLRPQ